VHHIRTCERNMVGGPLSRGRCRINRQYPNKPDNVFIEQ
jgi:hypothetical protein